MYIWFLFYNKQLVKTFAGKFECLGENSEKYLTFSVPIKKKLDNGKTITCKLKFIDSYRFMAEKLSDLVDLDDLIWNLQKIMQSMYEKKIQVRIRFYWA